MVLTEVSSGTTTEVSVVNNTEHAATAIINPDSITTTTTTISHESSESCGSLTSYPVGAFNDILMQLQTIEVCPSMPDPHHNPCPKSTSNKKRPSRSKRSRPHKPKAVSSPNDNSKRGSRHNTPPSPGLDQSGSSEISTATPPPVEVFGPQFRGFQPNSTAQLLHNALIQQQLQQQHADSPWDLLNNGTSLQESQNDAFQSQEQPQEQQQKSKRTNQSTKKGTASQKRRRTTSNNKNSGNSADSTNNNNNNNSNSNSSKSSRNRSRSKKKNDKDTATPAQQTKKEDTQQQQIQLQPAQPALDGVLPQQQPLLTDLYLRYMAALGSTTGASQQQLQQQFSQSISQLIGTTPAALLAHPTLMSQILTSISGSIAPAVQLPQQQQQQLLQPLQHSAGSAFSPVISTNQMMRFAITPNSNELELEHDGDGNSLTFKLDTTDGISNDTALPLLATLNNDNAGFCDMRFAATTPNVLHCFSSNVDASALFVSNSCSSSESNSFAGEQQVQAMDNDSICVYDDEQQSGILEELFDL